MYGETFYGRHKLAKIKLIDVYPVSKFTVLPEKKKKLPEIKWIEPRHEKTCLRDFRPGKTQTGRLSYRDKPESWNSQFNKYRYYTKQRTTKVLIRLCGCASWSAPSLFAYGKNMVFSWRGSIVLRCYLSRHFFSNHLIPIISEILNMDTC